MNVLSLFAGIGGLELGLERAGMTTVGQVEINAFCQRVLAKHWPEVPKHDDVRTTVEWWGAERRPVVDVVCGGFPCQDISNAGRREGIAGARSGLWSYMRDVVRGVRPRYVVMENVSALLGRGLDVVAADLAESGYDLEWDCVPASSLGAPHERDRWFGIAYPQRERVRVEPVAQSGRRGAAITTADGASRAMANADRSGFPDLQGWGPITERAGWRAPDRADWWRTEPDVGRVVHGVSTRLDRRVRKARVHALGNAVVPQVAEHIGRLIVEAEARAAA